MVLDSHKFKYRQIKKCILILTLTFTLCRNAVLNSNNVDKKSSINQTDQTNDQSMIKSMDVLKSSEASLVDRKLSVMIV